MLLTAYGATVVFLMMLFYALESRSLVYIRLWRRMPGVIPVRMARGNLAVWCRGSCVGCCRVQEVESSEAGLTTETAVRTSLGCQCSNR